MTGWGQTGPLAHDGRPRPHLHRTDRCARRDRTGRRPPRPPLNLVGDFGGGALYLALGIAARALRARPFGLGQVIDAAIVDGTASMMANFSGMSANGERALDHGRRLLGGDAPNYRCYACADGRYVAVGPLEPKFFAVAAASGWIARSAGRLRPSARPPAGGAQADALAASSRRKPRDAWVALLEGTDACVAPVLRSTKRRRIRTCARATSTSSTTAWCSRRRRRASRARRAPCSAAAPPAPGEAGATRCAGWGVPC